MRMKRINISLTMDQFSKLAYLASKRTQEEGKVVSISSVIREILDKYLNGELKEVD